MLHHPGSEQPGWSAFFRAFVTKWYTLFQAFLGQVAWFFLSADGLVFFKHWPTFFLTFARRFLVNTPNYATLGALEKWSASFLQ